MKSRLFTVVHSHSGGYTHYVFCVEVPDDTAKDWHPSIDVIVDQLDIEFEPLREEWIEIEQQGDLENIPTIAFDAVAIPRCDECGERFKVEETGVSHHITSEGEVDHEQDADHVPYQNAETE